MVAAGVGGDHDLGAAIAGVGLPAHRTAALQGVHQGHDLAGIQVQELSEFTLGGLLTRADQREHGEVTHLQVQLGEHQVRVGVPSTARPGDQELNLGGHPGALQTLDPGHGWCG